MPLPRIKTNGKVRGNRLVRPQKAYAQTATVILLTSTLKISPKHLGPYGLNKRKGRSCKSFFIAKREEGKIKTIKMKLRNNATNPFSDTKEPTLVHILRMNVYQTYSTNYLREGRTSSFSLFARFRARGATAFSISSSSASS